MNRWTLALDLPQDQRFFLSQRGIAIADRSGRNPDHTDDGPLFFDDSRPLVVHATTEFQTLNIPVHKERAKDGGYWCGVGLEHAEQVVALLATHHDALFLEPGDDKSWVDQTLLARLRAVRGAAWDACNAGVASVPAASHGDLNNQPETD